MHPICLLGPGTTPDPWKALGWLHERATMLPKHAVQLRRLRFRQSFETQDPQGDGMGFRAQESLMSKNRRHIS